MTYLHSYSKSTRLLAPLATSLLLSACGGDSDTLSTTTPPTLTGTAAVGAPISGATVSAKCKSGATATSTTRSNGSYGLVLLNSAFPCAVRVTGGTANGAPAPTLHSFASTVGTANITPLTDLALALQLNTAAGQSLAAWFATPSNWDTISTGLTTSLNTLRTALTTAGYSLPSTWTAGSITPFTATFTPNPSSDPYDQLLESIADAIESSATYADYSAMLTAFVGGAALPAPAPTSTTLPDPAGTGSALGTGDGVTGTYNGTVYTYNTTRIDSGNSNSPSLIIAEGSNNQDNWRISPGAINQAIGLYNCNTSSDAAPWLWVSLGIKDLGASSTLGTGKCRIEIIQNDSSVIEGRFVSTIDKVGAETGDITILDGYFRFHKSTSSGPETQPATVNAALAKTYSLNFSGNCNGACSFVNGQNYSATVNSDSTLTIDGKTLTNPVRQKIGGAFNQTEIIWSDGNLRYALSNNQTGLFNEINVGDASQPQAGGLPKFLGQLTESTPPVSGGGSIGLASFSTFDSSSLIANTVSAVAGTHDIAIYQAPNISEIGAGKLIVSNSGGNVSFTLQGAAGTTLAAVSVPIDDSSCGDGVCVNVFDQWTAPTGGRRVGIRDYYADPIKKAILVGFLPNGYLYGTVDGGYSFRNNITAFGTAIPTVFSTLAGTYTGAHQTNTCLPNPVTVTISSEGSVNLQGKTSLSCAAQNHTATWDGQDDYIAPSATGSGAQLFLDSTRIGGSQTGGGITIDIPDASSASTFSQLYSNFAGTNGHITLPNPTKQ